MQVLNGLIVGLNQHWFISIVKTRELRARV